MKVNTCSTLVQKYISQKHSILKNEPYVELLGEEDELEVFNNPNQAGDVLTEAKTLK